VTTTTPATAAPAATAAPIRRSSRIGRRRRRAAWLFLTPSLIALAIFTFWPMLQAVYLSFTDYNLLQPAEFIGFDNYIELFQDEAVLNAFANTLLYAVVVTPVTIVLALVFALFLNQKMILRGFFRTAIFLPFIVSLGVIAIAWTFLFDPNIGLLAYWLQGIGIVTGQSWTSDPALAMPAVMIVGVWKNVGFYTVIYLAGLQSVPAELNEAARIDGANAWQRFRGVTWPLLSNQTLLVSVMAMIASLQTFDQIYVMTRGGPFFRTETLVMLIYREGFSGGELKFGYGSAISIVLLLFVLILSIVQFRYFRRREVTY
jgi:ABC-type sugar transport system permease subunit